MPTSRQQVFRANRLRLHRVLTGDELDALLLELLDHVGMFRTGCFQQADPAAVADDLDLSPLLAHGFQDVRHVLEAVKLLPGLGEVDVNDRSKRGLGGGLLLHGRRRLGF